jgi:hypothetical protein
MAFPSSPTNGQQYTSNGILYQYNSTKGAWQAVNVSSAAQLNDFVKAQSLTYSVVFGV